eukprot:4509234-Pyramimonas_sp.AAC.1
MDPTAVGRWIRRRLVDGADGGWSMDPTSAMGTEPGKRSPEPVLCATADPGVPCPRGPSPPPSARSAPAP